MIFASYAAGVIAALLLVGRLSDEIGRRPVLLPGIALSALSAVAFLLGGDRREPAAPPEERAEVASSFFVVAYVAISVPVIGVGLLAEAAGLRTAGLVFEAAVAALAAIVLVLLAGGRNPADSR
jgi:MFS family permease